MFSKNKQNAFRDTKIFLIFENTNHYFMLLTCILIDDEIFNLKNLEIIVTENFDDIQILGCFQSVAAAKDFLLKNEVDFIFLDISMPNENGFDLLEYFPNHSFDVIFVTAYQNFAIKALRSGAKDYLMKPIIMDELKNAIEKVRQNPKYKKAISSKITLTYEGGKSIVDPTDIIYIKGLDNLSTVYLSNNKHITVSKTLKHFESVLDDSFFRIHKSYIININKVSKIIHSVNPQAEMCDKSLLPISRRNTKKLNENLQNGKQ